MKKAIPTVLSISLLIVMIALYTGWNFKKPLLLSILLGILIAALFITIILAYIHSREEKLKALAELQTFILDNTTDLFICTKHNGEIVNFNKAAEQLLGYKSEEVLGKRSFLQFFDPKTLEEFAENLSNSLQTIVSVDMNMLALKTLLTPNKKIETKLFLSDGNVNEFSLSVIPLHDKYDKIDGFLVAGSNLTEREVYDQTLVKASLAAQDANMAKSKFLASISHDLRTPLSSVIGFSLLLAKNKSGNFNEKEMSYLHRIIANSKYLLHLIDNILSLTKFEFRETQANFSSIDLKNCINEVIQQIEGRFFGKKIDFKLIIPENLSPLISDEEKLQRIINNLLDNAIKFSKDTVIIEVIENPKTHRAISLNITDKGIGIAPENISKIFSPFFQVDSSFNKEYSGTGLGLSIVKNLCNLLDYKIEVKSSLNKGTTVSVQFSDKAPSIPQMESKQAVTEYNPNELRTVLIIDDDPDTLSLLSVYFKNLNFTPVLASSGYEGLRLVKEKNFDFVTVNLYLIEPDGFKVIQQIKEDLDYKNLPIAVISPGALNYKNIVKGPFAFVNKPFTQKDIENLLLKLEQIKSKS